VFFFSAMVLHQYFFGITTFLISLFLILLILVQRGRGGGLSGALGGPGGQSAFGTKAGDIFTRITIVTAAIWIFWCALAVWWMQIPDVVDLNSGGGAAIPVGGAVSDGIGGADGAAGGLIPPSDLPGLEGTSTFGSQTRHWRQLRHRLPPELPIPCRLPSRFPQPAPKKVETLLHPPRLQRLMASRRLLVRLTNPSRILPERLLRT
jgi:protein translocase SecG subunit